MSPTSQHLDLHGVRALLDDLLVRRDNWTSWEQLRYDQLAALEVELLERQTASA